MIVYVESNFVLELALRQEQEAACAEILRLCETGRFRVLVPAYSIAEPYETLLRRRLSRQRMKETLDRELQQLSRTTAYSQQLAGFQGLTSLLTDSANEDLKRLEEVRSRLLACAEVIPLDGEALTAAARYQVAPGLSPQDAIVYASVLSHLARIQEPRSCFLTRDSDFDDPDVTTELRALDCKLFSRFDTGLSYLQTLDRERPA